MQSNRLTALETLAEYEKVAATTAERCRRRYKEARTFHNAESKGYHEGVASGYNNARAIMQAELSRLKNLFQNGALNIDSFGV